MPRDGNKLPSRVALITQPSGLRSTKFGTLKLGRVYSPFYLAVAGRIDPINGDGIGSMTGFTSIGHNLSPGNPYDTQKMIPNLDVRTSNAIDYASPTLYGVAFRYQRRGGGSNTCRHCPPLIIGSC